MKHGHHDFQRSFETLSSESSAFSTVPGRPKFSQTFEDTLAPRENGFPKAPSIENNLDIQGGEQRREVTRAISYGLFQSSSLHDPEEGK